MTTMTFTIGVQASCTDGVFGRLTQVVINPLTRTVTHLVVEPPHRSGLGKLVPVSRVRSSLPEVHLACTLREFQAFPHAEQTHFLPGDTGGYGGFAPGHALLLPYYGLGGTGGLSASGLAMGSVIPRVGVSDTLPREVAIRRGQRVRATDGDIGHVQGMVFDRSTGRMTHPLLQEGHLLGRRDVAIPVTAITGLAEGVVLSLNRMRLVCCRRSTSKAPTPVHVVANAAVVGAGR